MRTVRIAMTLLAGAMLCVGSAHAQMSAAQLEPVERHQPHPGSAALAAIGNVVFMPVRIALTTVGAGLGGLTGWLTAGNKNAADDIWRLPPFDGQTYLQPEMLYGEEPLMIGQLEFRMHVTQP
jgi:hypothetical protein